ncbi:hypothetical protein [Wolbachia endosymbiont (group A) of Myopa testacea]|uniref:hypothetical protein n=1 Tax=Wolbachia endosymbiont (group A) of Myopa testacea TaxID=3066148 RepID=UPI0031330A6E
MSVTASSFYLSDATKPTGIQVAHKQTIVFSKANDKGIICFFKVGKAMVYSVDLREKAVSLVKKGKSKVEVAEVFEIDTI